MDSSSSTMRIEAGAPGIAARGFLANITASDMHSLSRSHHGKLQMEGRPFARPALHTNLPGMFLNDAVSDRESEARAALRSRTVGGFCGEKGIVNPVNVFLRDAAAGIGNHDVHAAAVGSAHGEGSALRHGVFGVEEQIQKYLLQFSGIAVHAGDFFCLALHFDFGALELVLE